MTVEGQIQLQTVVVTIAVAAATSLAASAAQAASIKEIFEKYNLIGTFSYDCNKPADKTNLYYVNRPLDADNVQRDRMSAPTTRDRVAMLDKAEELRPNELRVNGTEDGQPAELVWHIEPNRMLQWEATVNGKQYIRDGVNLSTQYKMPFLNRCGDVANEVAQRPNAPQSCFKGGLSLDESIAACTDFIQSSGTTKSEDLAGAFNNRGKAYSDNHDYDRAIVDYTEAI